MRSLGHAEVADHLGNVRVVETLTCAHCSRVYPKPQNGEPSGFCHMCFSPVCLQCGALTRCDPFERKLERIERRDRLWQQLGA